MIEQFIELKDGVMPPSKLDLPPHKYRSDSLLAIPRVAPS